MMRKYLFLALAIAGGLGQTVITSQYGCVTDSQYTLCQNLWMSSGVGNQSSTFYNESGYDVAWSTTWNWANNLNNVKSYANVISNAQKGVQLQNIRWAPTEWNWAYVSHSACIRADISYNIWFGTVPAGEPAMIWLSELGDIQPVGSQIASDVSIAGYTWNLWRGPKSNWEVISFVITSGDLMHMEFSADLKEFFNYLVQNQAVAETQWVHAIRAGTETFTGSATLMTDTFSVTLLS